MERSNGIWGQLKSVTRTALQDWAGDLFFPRFLPPGPFEGRTLMDELRPNGPEFDLETGASAIRTLVIEGTDFTATILKELRGATEVAVDSIHDPRSALHRIRSDFYDVVVADLPLAHMSAEDFFRGLVAVSLEQAARVVFLASDLGDPEVRRFLTGAGRPFLTQPVDPAELQALIVRVGLGPLED